MTSISLSRRRFLHAAGASALTISLMGRITDIQAQADSAAAHAATLDYHSLAGQYSLAPQVSYLNHGSIGTIPINVQQAHISYLQLCETNPWLHMWGGVWDSGREQVRQQAAEMLGCNADQLALTHNVTETFNLLAQGLPLVIGDEVLFSSLNHPGASICWTHQSQRRGFTIKQFNFPLVDVLNYSVDDIVALYAQEITDKTRVLVLPHIDNTIGLRHPITELANMAHAKGVEFVLVDGAQTFGMLPLEVASSGVDVYATSPHKWVQAPKGLGAAYINKKLFKSLQPMWVTWGQERWHGSVRVFEDYGTRNFPALMALGDALHFQAQLGAVKKLERYQALWRHTMAKVDATSGLVWKSPRNWDLSGSLYSIGIKHAKASDTAKVLFEKHGVVVRPFDDPQLNSLRVSPNVFTTEAEINRFCELITQLA